MWFNLARDATEYCVGHQLAVARRCILPAISETATAVRAEGRLTDFAQQVLAVVSVCCSRDALPLDDEVQLAAGFDSAEQSSQIAEAGPDRLEYRELNPGGHGVELFTCYGHGQAFRNGGADDGTLNAWRVAKRASACSAEVAALGHLGNAGLGVAWRQVEQLQRDPGDQLVVDGLAEQTDDAPGAGAPLSGKARQDEIRRFVDLKGELSHA